MQASVQLQPDQHQPSPVAINAILASYTKLLEKLPIIQSIIQKSRKKSVDIEKYKVFAIPESLNNLGIEINQLVQNILVLANETTAIVDASSPEQRPEQQKLQTVLDLWEEIHRTKAALAAWNVNVENELLIADTLSEAEKSERLTSLIEAVQRNRQQQKKITDQENELRILNQNLRSDLQITIDEQTEHGSLVERWQEVIKDLGELELMCIGIQRAMRGSNIINMKEAEKKFFQNLESTLEKLFLIIKSATDIIHTLSTLLKHINPAIFVEKSRASDDLDLDLARNLIETISQLSSKIKNLQSLKPFKSIQDGLETHGETQKAKTTCDTIEERRIAFITVTLSELNKEKKPLPEKITTKLRELEVFYFDLQAEADKIINLDGNLKDKKKELSTLRDEFIAISQITNEGRVERSRLGKETQELGLKVDIIMAEQRNRILKFQCILGGCFNIAENIQQMQEANKEETAIRKTSITIQKEIATNMRVEQVLTEMLTALGFTKENLTETGDIFPDNGAYTKIFEHKNATHHIYLNLLPQNNEENITCKYTLVYGGEHNKRRIDRENLALADVQKTLQEDLGQAEEDLKQFAKLSQGLEALPNKRISTRPPAVAPQTPHCAGSDVGKLTGENVPASKKPPQKPNGAVAEVTA